MIYLASPYSVGPKGAYGAENTGTASPNIRTRRFKAACRKAAELMAKGEVVFSPIAHSHSIELYGDPNLTTGDFWLNQDLDILSKCEKLVVYTMPGWERSRGIAKEVAFAEANGIPVSYIN
jgi:Domain of unknown function (DUF1937)